MSGWLNNFLLGRPGYEYALSANPNEMDPSFERLSADNRTLTGDLKERVFKTFLPSVALKSDWFPKADFDNIVSLLPVTDTFLAFVTRSGDWNMNFEPNIASSVSSVQIQNSSITKLDAIYGAGSFGNIVTIKGVWTALSNSSGTISGSGTNYYTGGSYNQSTRTITLGTNLPAVSQVYVSYSYTGWLVRLKKLSSPMVGGWVDSYKMDFALDPV